MKRWFRKARKMRKSEPELSHEPAAYDQDHLRTLHCIPSAEVGHIGALS